jgi:hypothetical protein
MEREDTIITITWWNILKLLWVFIVTIFIAYSLLIDTDNLRKWDIQYRRDQLQEEILAQHNVINGKLIEILTKLAKSLPDLGAQQPDEPGGQESQSAIDKSHWPCHI